MLIYVKQMGGKSRHRKKKKRPAVKPYPLNVPKYNLFDEIKLPESNVPGKQFKKIDVATETMNALTNMLKSVNE